MYLASVLSHLGAWKKLRMEHPVEFQEILTIIEQVKPEKTKMSREFPNRKLEQLMYSPKDISQTYLEQFKGVQWSIRNQDINDLYFGREHWSRVDAVKSGIGVEIALGKFSYAESTLFVKFPLFNKAGRIQIGVIIIPSKSMKNSLSSGTGSFEMVRDRLVEMGQLNLKFPVALLGFADIPSETKFEELTTDLDIYLIDKVGSSLVEMKLMTERKDYEFKERLPENEKIAKEACAMANHTNGGLIIIGIADTGEVIGLPRVELDASQLRIGSVIRGNCKPIPDFEFRIFDAENIIDRCILIIEVREMERKPCMAYDKVYIKSGSSTEPAKPDDIRRLLLGSLG